MSRGLGYTDIELQALLDIVEEVLPRSPNEWEEVSRRHIENYPGRTLDSIRRKFNALANHKKPTGDPHCPPTVRRAKRIFALIRERMDISDGEDDLGPDLLAPLPLPEVVAGGAEDVAVQEDENGKNLGTGDDEIPRDNVRDVQQPSVGLRTPSIEGLRVRTPRRNVVSSTNHSVNFPELVQFMMVRADAEARMERRRQEEREEMEERRRREREEADERYRRQREEAEDRREERMMRMMQLFMSNMAGGGQKRKRGDDNSTED